ncbi:endo-1,4-beta-xylanase [Micrococcales bacterium 31B]|nr:endo-1,4-beta-xylanase [Micrococcales bacterium 31B]
MKTAFSRRLLITSAAATAFAAYAIPAHAAMQPTGPTRAGGAGASGGPKQPAKPPKQPAKPGPKNGGAINPSPTPVALAQRSGNVAALTFDDGPNPVTTPLLLDYLHEHNIKAVFCVVGSEITKPGGAEILRRIVAEGHVLANHTTSYADMGAWSAKAVRKDLMENLRIIRQALGDPHAPVPYFRAPNGSWGVTPQVAVELGMQPLAVVNVINDWVTQDIPTLTANLRAAMKPGEVVLAHDSGGDRSGTLAAVKAVVDERLADGWTFTLPQATPDSPRLASAVLDYYPLKHSAAFPMGVAIDQRETTGAAADTLLHNFGQITPENHMKPEEWYDADRRFRINPQAVALMDFARDNGLRVYGHVLVWHSQVPAWFFEHADGTPLTDSAADQAELTARMRTHIFNVAKALHDGWGAFGAGNPLVAFDVVNEVIDDSPNFADGMRRSRWYEVLGENLVDLAFAFAQEAFNVKYAAKGPGAPENPVALFINDYNTEYADKRGRYAALIERLRERGAPITGVGHQFHVNMTIDVTWLEAALATFKGSGLHQAVTEFDMPTGTPVTDALREQQAAFIRTAFETFRAHADEMFAVTVWGLNDARSWRNDRGEPLLFADDYSPKLAFEAAVGHEIR